MTGSLGGGISTGDVSEFGLAALEQIETPSFALFREPGGAGQFGKFTLERRGDFGLEQRITDTNLGLTVNFEDFKDRAADTIESLRGGVSEGLDTTRGLLTESAGLRGDLADLAAQVEPGFGRLTENARRTIRDAAQRESGNLRSQFARRDLSGSSFEINEQRRLALDFALQEEEAVAEAVIDEIQLQRQIFDDVAGLLELDQQTLAEQAKLLAIELGAGELEANQFAVQLDAMKESFDQLQTMALLELQELEIVGNIANGVASAVASLAASDASAEASRFSSTLGSFTSLATGDFSGIGSLFG